MQESGEEEEGPSSPSQPDWGLKQAEDTALCTGSPLCTMAEEQLGAIY